MDAMRSLLVLDAVIGLGTVIVIHHTGKALYLYCAHLLCYSGMVEPH